MRIFINIIILLLINISIVSGNDNAGTAGMQFLKIGADARGNSLGGAVIGEVSGVESLYWNPAGLSGLIGREVILTYNRWLADMNYMYAGFGMPALFSKLGTFAGSITFLSEGTLDGDAEEIIELSSLSSYDLAVSAGYGLMIGKMDIGAALRFIQKSIFGESTSGVVADLGFQMNVFNNVRLGMVAKNLGVSSKIGDKPEDMPLMYQVALSYSYKTDKNSISGMISSDIMKDDTPYINFGLEYGYLSTLFLRAGYRFATEGDSLGGMKGLSLGIGGMMNGVVPMVDMIRADVTWIPMADLGNIMQITVMLSF